MSTVVVDDHLLLRVLAGDPPAALRAENAAIATTGLWHHRLCRALCDDSLIGALSRRLADLGAEIATDVLSAVVELPADIQVVSLRTLGWPMGRLAHSGHRLNLLSLEALAAAQHLGAPICLSPDDDNLGLRDSAASVGVAVHVLD